MHIAKAFEIRKVGYDCFFGYYDRSMSSLSGNLQIFLSVEAKGDIFDREHRISATVCLASQNGTEVTELLETDAWSYQLGNLNSWLSEDEFIFHTRENGRIKSHLYSLKDASRETIANLACYGLQPDSGLGVFFDIGRAGSIRPSYGLGATRYGGADVRILRISTKECLAKLKEDELRPLFETSDDLFVYVEHAIFMNNVPKIVLLVRAMNAATDTKHEKMLIWDFANGRLEPIRSITKATHYCVTAENQIFSFGSGSQLNRLGKLKGLIKRLPFVDFVRQRPKVRRKVLSEQYRLVSQDMKTISKIDFFQDGHPTVFEEEVIFDTYDQDGVRELYLFDTRSMNFTKLGEFASDPATDRTPVRCDLHPRSAGSMRIAVDHIVDNFRQISCFEVKGFPLRPKLSSDKI